MAKRQASVCAEGNGSPERVSRGIGQVGIEKCLKGQDGGQSPDCVQTSDSDEAPELLACRYRRRSHHCRISASSDAMTNLPPTGCSCHVRSADPSRSLRRPVTRKPLGSAANDIGLNSIGVAPEAATVGNTSCSVFRKATPSVMDSR